MLSLESLASIATFQFLVGVLHMALITCDANLQGYLLLLQ